jgi:hypothetical protein
MLDVAITDDAEFHGLQKELMGRDQIESGLLRWTSSRR